MSYTTVEDAALAVVRKATDYTTANTATGVPRVLQAGITKGVILTPGPFRRELYTLTQVRNIWTVNVELYIPYTDSMDTLAANVRTERQSLIDVFDKWPLLDGTAGVDFAFVESAGPPEEWIMGGRWWRQVMALRVEEIVTPDRQEP